MKTEVQRINRAFPAMAQEIEDYIRGRRTVWQGKFALSGDALEAAIVRGVGVVLAAHGEPIGSVTAEEAYRLRQEVLA